MDPNISRIGFIGAGLMGAPMVRRLLRAGFSVRVWNRTQSRLPDLLSMGAIAATSPVDAARDVDVICLCLANQAAMEAVLFGPEGVASARGPLPPVVDFSTIGPIATLAFARRLDHQGGVSWVDAPVSGGVVGANEGRLVLMCGGPRETFIRLGPIFEPLAQQVTHVGALGAGQTLKLCNQIIVSTNLLAIAEALTLAQRSGLDPNMIPSALRGGFADSLPLQIFGPRMAARVTEPKLGELAVMLKDLTTACDLARDLELGLPLSAAALNLYKAADLKGLAKEDLSILMQLYEAAPTGGLSGQ
jgi:3-hydroxyisobutyrate dehydrogenase